MQLPLINVHTKQTCVLYICVHISPHVQILLLLTKPFLVHLFKEIQKSPMIFQRHCYYITCVYCNSNAFELSVSETSKALKYSDVILSTLGDHFEYRLLFELKIHRAWKNRRSLPRGLRF